MLLYIGLLVGGLVALYFGAEWLVRGSASLALRCGVSALVAGLTVVAYGTSMPELIVSLKATLDGQSGLALGNIVGSNLFNVGIILGLTAVVYPVKIEFRVIRVDLPIMLVLTLLFSAALLTGMIERWVGLLFTIGLVVYTVLQIAVARRSKTPKIEEEFAEAMPAVSRSIPLDITWIVLGIILLGVGGQILVMGGSGLARSLGVSETIIGLTVVAAGTSAPELAATLVAALRREADIAVGNIVGSNIFNILSVAGITSLIVPMDASTISHLDIGAMVFLSFLMLPLAWTGFVLKRWEGLVLLAAYGVYLFLIWPR
jgi:cation:H+ antiporter